MRHKKLLAVMIALTLGGLVAACPVAQTRRDNGAAERQSARYPLVAVPAGSFSMGSGATRDEATHEVRVTRPFLMGQEVTQGLWREVTGERPVETRRQRIAGHDAGPCAEDHGVSFVGDDLPVVCVDWLEAVRFANAMSARENLAPAYVIDGTSVRWERGADGYRLPTEAEWEWAARSAGAAADPPAGTCPAANVADASADRVWGWGAQKCDDGYPGLAPVGALPAGIDGLADLGGNVAEWCWDAYEPYPEGAVADPAPEGPSDRPSGHVTRGASFRTRPAEARPWSRGFGMGNLVSHAVGLRLVRNGR